MNLSVAVGVKTAIPHIAIVTSVSLMAFLSCIVMEKHGDMIPREEPRGSREECGEKLCEPDYRSSRGFRLSADFIIDHESVMAFDARQGFLPTPNPWR